MNTISQQGHLKGHAIELTLFLWQSMPDTATESVAKTQLKAAPINQFICLIYNLYFQLLWYPCTNPGGMEARVSPM